MPKPANHFLNKRDLRPLQKEFNTLNAHLSEKANGLFSNRATVVRFVVADTLIEYMIRNLDFLEDETIQARLFHDILKGVQHYTDISQVNPHKRAIVKQILTTTPKIRRLPHLNSEKLQIFVEVYHHSGPLPIDPLPGQYQRILNIFSLLLEGLRVSNKRG